MENRRLTSRRRTLKQGKVVLSDTTLVDCVVRDMSDIGARLEFGAPTELPAEFRVLIVASNVLIPARLEWQRGLSAGAHFTGAASEAPARKI